MSYFVAGWLGEISFHSVRTYECFTGKGETDIYVQKIMKQGRERSRRTRDSPVLSDPMKKKMRTRTKKAIKRSIS